MSKYTNAGTKVLALLRGYNGRKPFQATAKFVSSGDERKDEILAFDALKKVYPSLDASWDKIYLFSNFKTIQVSSELVRHERYKNQRDENEYILWQYLESMTE